MEPPKVVQEVFPNARLVFDRFHVMQPVNEELNKIRRQTGMTLKGSKFILLKNGADLTEAEQIKLASILAHSQRLRLAYELKKDFRNIFETCHTVEEAKAQLLLWLKKARTVYCDVLTTIRNHLDGICNYFLSRTTSGVMEGINNNDLVDKKTSLWRELTSIISALGCYLAFLISFTYHHHARKAQNYYYFRAMYTSVRRLYAGVHVSDI